MAVYHCACKRMSNYEIMKQQMQSEFLKYDQEKMIQKFHLQHDSDYIFMEFLGKRYQIQRKNGKIRWSEDAFVTSEEAGYNEAMTIYDVLCYSKEDCYPSGEFLNMKRIRSSATTKRPTARKALCRRLPIPATEPLPPSAPHWIWRD